MADFNFDMEWHDEAARRMFDALAERARDMSPLMAEVAEDILLPGTQQHFADEVDPEGRAWPDLKPATKERKKTTAKLREDNYLYGSLRPEYGPKHAQLGSDRPYAAIHQFGGTSDMAPGPAAIPARPYLGISEEDEALIIEAAQAWFRPAARG